MKKITIPAAASDPDFMARRNLTHPAAEGAGAVDANRRNNRLRLTL
jgi:hypothetical protein